MQTTETLTNTGKAPSLSVLKTIEEGAFLMFKYSDILASNKGRGYHEIEWARKIIYEYAVVHGIKPSTREFRCSRNTVRNIIRNGWQLKSRAPKNKPNKIGKDLEDSILRFRQDKGMGPEHIVMQYGVESSPSTVYRVLLRRSEDLPQRYKVNGRKRKYKQTKNLQKIKQKLKPFQHCSIPPHHEVQSHAPAHYGQVHQ